MPDFFHQSAPALDQRVQRLGQRQSLRLAGEAVVGGQGIDGEGLVVGALGGVQGLAVPGDGLVHAALLPGRLRNALPIRVPSSVTGAHF